MPDCIISVSYSRTPDGFEQRAEFKIPDKVWDVELTRKQRSDLQLSLIHIFRAPLAVFFRKALHNPARDSDAGKK